MQGLKEKSLCSFEVGLRSVSGISFSDQWELPSQDSQYLIRLAPCKGGLRPQQAGFVALLLVLDSELVRMSEGRVPRTRRRRRSEIMKVYEMSLNVVREIHRDVLPKVRRVDRHLADQLNRASVSVSLNIAEGGGFRNRRDRNHFAIALGSCREVRCALEIVRAIGVIGTSVSLDEQLDQMCAMLWKLSS